MSNKFYEATKTPDHQEASLWYCGLLVSGTFGHFSSFLNRCERYEYLPVEFSDKKPRVKIKSKSDYQSSTAYKLSLSSKMFINYNSFVFMF